MDRYSFFLNIGGGWAYLTCIKNVSSLKTQIQEPNGYLKK